MLRVTFAISFLLLFSEVFAQGLNTYGITRNLNVPYTSIVGAAGTTTFVSWRNPYSLYDTDENLSAATNIGFTFTYNGIAYTQFSASTNGFITFTPPVSYSGNWNQSFGGDNEYFELSNGTSNTLAPFYDDLVTSGNTNLQSDLNNSIQYRLSGTAPNLVLTVEWINMRNYTQASNLNFQVKLYQSGSRIEFNYGTSAGGSVYNYFLGLNTNVTSNYYPNPGEMLLQQLADSNYFTNSYRYQGLTSAPAANSQYVFQVAAACQPPAVQPSGLTFSGSTFNTISGSFTPAAGNLNYLVVRTSTNVAPTPQNGTAYLTGANTSGDGTVISSGPQTNFVATNLSASTTYYFWIFSYINGTGCSSPRIVYNLTSPLTGSSTTTVCSVSGVIPVGTGFPNTSITAALLSLKSSGLSGPVILELRPTYSTVNETFPIVLYDSIPCHNAVNTITIRPHSTVASAIILSSANSTTTLDINRGDFYIIDGRPGGTGTNKFISIENTSLTASAVRFINAASSNVLSYCTVRGVYNSTQGGVIFFSNGITAFGGHGSGNNDNIISNCDIRDGSTTPNTCIFSRNSTSYDEEYSTGNQILSNNIYNYFSATAENHGIHLTIGNTHWTISGNSFYQTTARNTTTISPVNAVMVNNIGDGYVIRGNFIGGTAPGCGGSRMVYTGVPRFLGIHLNVYAVDPDDYFSSTVATAIDSNVVRNLSVTSSQEITMLKLESGTINCGDITGNFIGGIQAADSVIITGTSGNMSSVVAMGTGSAVSTSFTNNYVTGVHLTSVGDLAIVYVMAYTIDDVTQMYIRNNIFGNPSSNVNSITFNNNRKARVIYSNVGQETGVSYANISGNTISNISNVNTGTAAALHGIFVSSDGDFNVNNNIIRNLTISSANTGTNENASLAGLIAGGTYPGNVDFLENRIFNLVNNNATAVNTNVLGIYLTTGLISSNITANRVMKNFIHSLDNSSTGTASSIIGIKIAADKSLVANNMIRLGIDSSGNAIGGDHNISGIRDSIGGNKYYHNSVFVGGAATGALNSYAFSSVVADKTRDIRNNIFMNRRTNSGSGKSYAIQLSDLANGSLKINYNDYYTTGAGTVLGNFNNTDYADIISLRQATAQDSLSFSNPPNFINTNGSSDNVNLHVQSPTAVESAGTPIQDVSNDYDLESRSTTAPDIGADEGTFTINDLVPPSILFTPLLVSCNTGNRTLTATIFDTSGVATTGALRPRIYYRKNSTGAWFDRAGVLQSGTGIRGEWLFSIVAADMGGVVQNDTIFYYVIAQDVSGQTNIISNSFGAVATSVNAIVSHPAVTNKYVISSATSLSGTFNVGAGQTYPTLSSAFAAYNNACLSGPVTFLLTDAVYNIISDTIKNNVTASGYAYLTIKPTLANTQIIGNSTAAAIVLYGADYISINGSTGNNVQQVCPQSSVARNLTIKNTNASIGSAVVWLSAGSAGDSLNNCEVKNCNIYGNSSSTTKIGLGAGGGVGNIGVANGVRFSNNNIGATQYGIYCGGGINTANKNETLEVTGNFINNPAPLNVGKVGIYINITNDILVSGNTVGHIVNTSDNTDIAGISLGYDNNFTVTGTGSSGAVSNVVVSNNVVDTVRQTNTYSAVGIAVSWTVSGHTLISNNMISGVSANAGGSDIGAGIVLGGNNGNSTTDVLHNTVAMQGVIGGAVPASQPSACLVIIYNSNPSSNINIANNIFSNTQSGNSGATLKCYTIGTNYVIFPGSITSDFNDLYSGGNGPGTYGIGITGGLNTGTLRTTMDDWNTATSRDTSSQNVLPDFVSATDLHLKNSLLNFLLDNTGTFTGDITTDIDCQYRDPDRPDIGADEFSSCKLSLISAIVSPQPSAICNSSDLSITSYLLRNCQLIARVEPNGLLPVSGLINACVHRAASVQTVNGRPYLQRYYNISSNGQNTFATSSVTLYYAQSEFDAYNLANGDYFDLPTGPTDTTALKNIRILQSYGTSASGVPGSYSGISIERIPSIVDIAWSNKLQAWVIRFNSVGFGGFYLSTSRSVCPGATIKFISDIVIGNSFQWQVNTGSGFTNISNGAQYSGVTTDTLTIINAPSSLYGSVYRCFISNLFYSQQYELKFKMAWQGTVDNAWENTANWPCGVLPDANTDVIMEPGKPRYPVINSLNATARSLKLPPGTSVRVLTGKRLTVNF